MKDKPKVAFICIHNSCRSQIVESLGKHLAADVFKSYSAGIEEMDKINSDAVRIMKYIYGIDMEISQYPKHLDDLPSVDVVITMGCNMFCPYISSKHQGDWGLDDPTEKSDEEFIKIIKIIESNILKMRKKIANWT